MTFCWESISTCSTTFLNISFNWFWMLIMNYISNIFLIYSHTKSDRCNDYFYFALHKMSLIDISVFLYQLGMIRSRWDAICFQVIYHFLDSRYRNTIYYSLLILVVIKYQVHNMFDPSLFNLKIQIRSIYRNLVNKWISET